MQVSIKFDTEKESIEELQKLVASLQDLIEKKQKMQSSPQPSPVQPSPEPSSQPTPEPVQQQPAQTTPPSSGKTGSGAQIVDYDPGMEQKMSDIFSGKGA